MPGKRRGSPKGEFSQKRFYVYQIWIMRSAPCWTASALRIPPGLTHSR